MGSPPPMRGKAEGRYYRNVIHGITPAYAGKSLRKQGEQRYFEDHPRLCGEKFSGIWENIKGVGSPPPMRGKAPPYKIAVANMRITPAYAGKSFTPEHVTDFAEDHPRLCGEKCNRN